MNELEVLGIRAKEASFALQNETTERKNRLLCQIAEDMIIHTEEILTANVQDLERGKENGMSEALLDRLMLNESRVQAMAEGLRQIADLPDPVGELMEEFYPENGLHMQKCRVPIGVIGMIYESRPNVTADAFGLCFKSGNVVILKGGSDAISSNTAITKCIRTTLEREGMNPDVIGLIMDTRREVAAAFMRLRAYVDLLIPRGGAGLIRSVVENSTIPVIETGTGNCHVYVDQEADFEVAIAIIINAKTQRLGVCNACESIVVHEKVAELFLPRLEAELGSRGVELRADQDCCQYMKTALLATEEDFGMEYLDKIISIKMVATIDEAIAHINQYNTKHSDVIITKNTASAEQFLQQVDSACVYANASSRFSDGFEFGFGAEIGISTQKIHARGPMGLRELTSYKYLIRGNGQIRG